MKKDHTQRIASGLYLSLHSRASLIILLAFLTLQFFAVRYLEMEASEHELGSIVDKDPTSFRTSSI